METTHTTLLKFTKGRSKLSHIGIRHLIFSYVKNNGFIITQGKRESIHILAGCDVRKSNSACTHDFCLHTSVIQLISFICDFEEMYRQIRTFNSQVSLSLSISILMNI